MAIVEVTITVGSSLRFNEKREALGQLTQEFSDRAQIIGEDNRLNDVMPSFRVLPLGWEFGGEGQRLDLGVVAEIDARATELFRPENH